MKGLQEVREKREGALRLLTQGEITLAHEMFGGAIAYNRVWVHCDSYLPFGLQAQNYGMAPNGELYFRKNLYEEDFSEIAVPTESKHLYIHEMVHVWQHQRGMWVRTRGLFSWASDYTYTLHANKKLKDYAMEQQACIIADYWLWRKHGYNMWLYQRQAVPGRIVNYRGKDNSRNIFLVYQKMVSRALAGRG